MSKETPDDLEYLRQMRRAKWALLKHRTKRIKEKIVEEVNPIEYTREHPLIASAVGFCTGVILHQIGRYELKNYRSNHDDLKAVGTKIKQGGNEIGMILKTFLMLLSRGIVTALVSAKTASVASEHKHQEITGQDTGSDFYH